MEEHDKQWTMASPHKLDRWLNLLRGGIDMILLILCGIHVCTNITSTNPLDDVWYVLFMICVLRVIDDVDR